MGCASSKDVAPIAAIEPNSYATSEKSADTQIGRAVANLATPDAASRSRHTIVTVSDSSEVVSGFETEFPNLFQSETAEPPETESSRSENSSTQSVLTVPTTSEDEAIQTLPETVLPEKLEELPPPQEVADDDGLTIDFGSALVMASGQNPRVSFAVARIFEAYAQKDQAEILWIPDLNAGIGYNRHIGPLQNAAGLAIDTDRSSVYAGGGARAAGTSSPSFPGISARFALSDAIYQPRITAEIASARQHQADAETNDVLLETALAYQGLLAALQRKVIAERTYRGICRVAELTDTFAKAGEGNQSDSDRAHTELIFRQDQLLRTDEEIEVANIRLHQLLSLDGQRALIPVEPAVVPIEMVPMESDAASLVAIGLEQRPELSEQRHLVRAACEQLKMEKASVLIPSVILGMSYGGFGAGTDGFIGGTGDRLDLDIAAYWNVRNFGFGERAARNQMRARIKQAEAEHVRTMDLVAREVVEAKAQAKYRFRRIGVTKAALVRAESAFESDFQRIRQNVGLPIEAIQSIGALDLARRNYLQSIVDYNESQFRLHRAMGWPITAISPDPTSANTFSTPIP